MRFRFHRILLLLLLTTPCSAANYYSAPDSAGGDGSIGNPWNLNIAFTNSSPLNGNTLYLRGGRYHGHFRSTLNNATVRSYPGEWAVLDDAVVATLVIAVNTTTNKFVLANSEWFQPAQVLVMTTGEHVQLSSVANGTNWTVTRAWNGTPGMSHSQGTAGVLQDPIIKHTGSSSTFRDFEIAGALSTNRVVGTNWWIGGGLDLDVGVSNRAINLVIHDTGHPGIGFWDQNGGLLYGNIMWGIGMYDYSPDYGGGVGVSRGSAVYSQNTGNLSTIENCIHFRAFTSGGKVFGETGGIKNFGFFSNIIYQCEPTVDGSSGSTSTSNLWYSGNVTLGSPLLSYVSLSNRATYFINNYVINGYFYLKEHADSILTNNIVFQRTNGGSGSSKLFYSSDYYPTNALGIVWDYNAYYFPSSASEANWDFSALNYASTNSSGGGILSYHDSGKGWTNWAPGWDAHSTYSHAGWPTDFQAIKVFTNAYDADRWHIAVVNTASTNYAHLPLSALGIASGQSVTLWRADLYATPYTNFIYSSGDILLPLTLTNITACNGSITNFVDESSNVGNPGLFNAFVLTRSSMGAISATTLTVGTLTKP